MLDTRVRLYVFVSAGLIHITTDGEHYYSPVHSVRPAICSATPRPHRAARSGVGNCGTADPTLRAEADGVPYDPAVATDDIVRQNALARIDVVQAMVHDLPTDSPIATVLTDGYIQKQKAWVEAEPDLEYTEWPPLLGWTMAQWRADETVLLDSDVRKIRDHPTSNPVQATAWLSARRGESRKLRAGFVETTAKARALAFAEANDGWTVAFDAVLANGRDVDILLAGPERSYYMECTVITESDEDQQVHDEWLEARKSTPDLLLARPGPFDSANAKGPSPYYDTNRFYIKVFDKLQKDGNPAQSQTSPDCPNILLLSCFPVHSAPLPFSPGLKWALDELFSGQPNMGAIKQMPPGTSMPDISLMTFLTRQWPTTATNLLQSPARLSGALIFNCLGLQSGRINYNAKPDQRVSHLEMTLLERVFLPARGWENLHPPMTAGDPEESATTTSARA
jgi:hypothetical protein